MSFFSRLINPSDNTISSKTFVGLSTFIIVVVQSMSSLFFGFKVDLEIFFGLIGLICACFGLNTVIANKKLDSQQAPDVKVGQADKVTVVKGMDTEVEKEEEPEETPVLEDEDSGLSNFKAQLKNQLRDE